MKIKSPITSFQSSLFLWFLWPIKKVFILVLFFWFLCLASNRFLWLCTFFLRGTMKHRSSLATDCVLTPKKKLLIHSDRYLYILAWLNDPIMVGRVRQIGQSYYVGCPVRWGGQFCWYWLCVGTSRYVLYFEYSALDFWATIRRSYCTIIASQHVLSLWFVRFYSLSHNIFSKS